MSSTTTLQSLSSLSTRWHTHKKTSPLPHRLAMRILEIVALAGAMFIVPTGIHRIVQSFDEVYELLGRRARSPYTPATPWVSVLVAGVLLAGWQVCLGRLSYTAVMEVEGARGRRSPWGRVLGRIIMPILLLSLGVHFAYQLLGAVIRPAEFVVQNDSVVGS
ncbi:hypothetical protein CC86DRAFT_110150 [Ophiobolus disseminans]|uniref:Uncharacterized protein n=1 Tax=Ophiobolus disseminans TaxID=1469910 RepID=A0A6A6ZK87_9PLEO|nr:hypothetical protein CC86DRAFT_110150 [Ophiobolus disseminans]